MDEIQLREQLRMALDDVVPSAELLERALDDLGPSRRSRRRVVMAGAVVCACFAVAVVVAVSAGQDRSARAPVLGRPNDTSAAARAVVKYQLEHPTFAVFDQPPTRVSVDRKAWLALRFDGGDLLLTKSKTDPTCQSSTTSTTSVPPDPCTPHLCLTLQTPPGVPHESFCSGTEPLNFSDSWGDAEVEFENGQPKFVWGVVPDVVTGVTYDGHEVSIVNNVFVVAHPAPFGRPTNGLPLSFSIGNCQRHVWVGGNYADSGANRPGPFDLTATCSP